MAQMRNLRDAYSQALIEVGKKNPNVVVLDADLALSTKTKRFGTLYPDRFFDMGIAEAGMMGTAAGLASCGKTVFASTFAVFATGRAYDPIRQSICYPNLNVKIVATHAGISVGGDGASHQMLEDIGLMRGLPNMRVIVPADANQMEAVIHFIADEYGPFYVRCGREDSPLLEQVRGFELGKAQVLRDGTDVSLIACGLEVYEALVAAAFLHEEGVEARVINCPTIKPIDGATIEKAARDTGAVVTAEEHNIYNGLGSAVAEVLVETYPVRMERVGVRDTFGESGDASELMKKYHIVAQDIADAAKRVLKR